MDFGEGGGVASFETPIGDVAGAKAEGGAEGVEEGAFAHAAVAGEEDSAAGNHLFHGVETVAAEGRYLEDRVAGIGVDGFQLVVYFPQLLVVEVALVEDERCGDVVGFGGDEEAVDEARGGAWEAESGHDAQEVDVGGDDVGLFRELGGAADDVVATVVDVSDDAGAVVLKLIVDNVAHGYGVGLLIATKTVVAAETTVDKRLGVGHDSVPTAGGAYDKAFIHHRVIDCCRICIRCR